MQIGVATAHAVENKRIFVVHEDEVWRTAIQLLVHDESEAHAFASVDEALGRAGELPPDALLVGVEAIRERGLGLLAELAARLPRVRIAVIAAAGDELARRCLGAGAHALLAPPFTVEGVRARIDRLLGRGKALGIAVRVER